MNPKLRFRDINGSDFPDWREKATKNLYKKIRNAFVGTATPYYVKQGYFYLESNNVKNGKINRINEVFINDFFYQKQKDNWLHTGDIVMVQSGHVGHTAVIPESLNNTAAHALIIIANPYGDTNSEYINYYFQTNGAKKGIENITKGNTIKHILASEVKQFYVSIPTTPEQERIASLFIDIDKKIASQSILIEKLKNTKDAMFVKMFPKEDSVNPTLRFKKEDGSDYADWRKEKLSKIASPKARIGWQGMRQSEFMDFGKYYLITGTDFDNGSINFDTCCYVEKYRYDQDKNIQVHNGDILVTKDGTLGKVAYVSKMDKPATLNAGVFVLNNLDEKMDSLFLYHYLAAPFLMEYANEQATGGTIKHLNQKVLVSFEVPIPEKEEQIKIGKCLSILDKEIEINQQKYNKLCDVKKALLSKLFPTKEEE